VVETQLSSPNAQASSSKVTHNKHRSFVLREQDCTARTVSLTVSTQFLILSTETKKLDSKKPQPVGLIHNKAEVKSNTLPFANIPFF
jgi:hypothetical protein